MDHVPYPRNAFMPKVEVPYICGDLEDYDEQGFSDYPVRRGWCESANGMGWMNCSQAVAAKRAQSWLYFGLLREILCEEYSKDAFLKRLPADNGYFIDTNRLPKYLDSWARTINRWKTVKGDSWRIQILQKSEELFVQVNHQTEVLEKAFESELLDDHFRDKLTSKSFFQCHKITLAIKVLLQTMRIAASNIGGSGDTHSKPSADRILPPKITLAQMVQRGFCSKQIQDFYGDQSTAVNFYMAALPRPLQESIHRACSTEKCVANNVDESRYETQHANDECQCRHTGPDAQQIRELIQDGKIPLIALGVSASGDPELEIVKAQPGVNYTAISHVWSGGLGNFQKNELPRCQLLHLHNVLLSLRNFKPQELLPGSFVRWKRVGWGSLPRWTRFTIPLLKIPGLSFPNLQETLLVYLGIPINQRKGRVLFWMDTLCIVGEEDSVPRAKAISKMALTYAAAENVLVLDPELQKISQEGLSQEQLCAHVLCCAWLTRSWTMQEARLSRRWLARFADGFFDPASAERTAEPDRKPVFSYKSAGNLRAEFARQIIWWYNRMPVMRRYSVFWHPDNVIEHPLVYFIQAWNELGKRSTSKPKDALGIFANMLNLSASEVLALPHEQRMKAMFRAQEQIPLQLIYNSAPKIQDPQNRWVPNFPAGGRLTLHYGVFNTNTGEIMLKEWTATPVGFLVDLSSPRTKNLRLVNSVTSETIWIEQDNEDDVEIDFRAPSSTATCYLLSDLESARLRPRFYYPCARFGIQKREGTIVHLIYEHGFVFRLQPPKYHGNDGQNDGSAYPAVEAEKIAADQKFQLVCDSTAWFQLQYKRDLVIQEDSTLGFEFYNTAWAIAMTVIWSPLFIVSIATARPFKFHLTQFIGSSVAILIRIVYAAIELGRMRKLIDNRAYELWIQTFDESKKEQNDDLSTSSSLEFRVWELSLAVVIAVALISKGAKNSPDRWLWWIGVTIISEVVFRLVVQTLWRKTSLGRNVKVWLKKKGKW